MMKINKFFYILLCLFAFKVYASELNINLDKTVMTEGDTLFLTVEYRGESNETPDLSGLSQDFQIVSNSSSRQFNIINGVMSQIKKWTLELKPLKTGKITIPPLKLGDLSSNYASVEVKEVTDVAFVPDSKENSNSPYFQIEQSLDTYSPYVQQQATLLVTIYDSIGLQDGSINISEESKKDWFITPLLNKPITKQETVNGRKMNVIHFAFAAFPQKSGTLMSPQVTFDGFYIKNSNFEIPHFEDDLMMFGVNFRNVFGQKVPVRMKTKTQTLSVKPIPAEASGKPWLPLKNLTLKASWPDKRLFKVGEAINREIKLTATGMQATMVPSFKFSDAEGLKQYPEKPETTESIVKGQLVTTAVINNVYIPTKSGTATIPPFELSWFNVDTNRLEKAVIPAEIIDILPNDSVVEVQQEDASVNDKEETSVANAKAQGDAPVMKEKMTETSFINAFKDAFYNNSELLKHFYDKFSGKIYIVCGVLAALLFYLVMRRKKSKQNPYFYEAVSAIKRHDYKAAKMLLLEWGRKRFNDDSIKNLNMIAEYVNDDDFRVQLNALNKFLYSDSDEVFDSAKFIEIFKRIDKMKRNIRKNHEVLPNLYN